MTSTFDRSVYRRTVAVVNGKGGVGKTSISTHLGALVAASGFRVLHIDLDPQGNTGDDLGYNHRDMSDLGEGLVKCVRTEGHVPPFVLRGVRENLDVIPGGVRLDEITDLVLSARNRRSRVEGARMVAAALAPYVGEYDLVTLDCPPRHEILQEAALAMAEWLLVPTKTDTSSINGIGSIADLFTEAVTINPDLKLLGVVLFGTNPTARTVQRGARERIRAMLGDDVAVLDATVRHVEKAAVDIRNRGQLAHELEAANRKPSPTGKAALSAGALAGDYQAIAEEALALIIKHEQGVSA